jgi:hypothetical protein
MPWLICSDSFYMGLVSDGPQYSFFIRDGHSLGTHKRGGIGEKNRAFEGKHVHEYLEEECGICNFEVERVLHGRMHPTLWPEFTALPS